MVRHCAIPSCRSTDLTILCHRFPKRKDAFDQWQSSLQLEHIDADLLMQRFVVCTLHFKATDYRNSNSRMLNAVAVPTLIHYDKAALYDLPTTGVSVRKNEMPTRTETILVERLLKADKTPASLEDRSEKAEQTPAFLEDSSEKAEKISASSEDGSMAIEPIEAIESLEALEEDCEEDIVYFIEEELNPTERAEGADTVSNGDQESRTSSPAVEEPELKRVKLDSKEDSDVVESDNLPIPELIEPVETTPKPPLPAVVVAYRNSSVQTEDVQIVSEEDRLQRRMVEEFYPEYAACSRLELAKQLKEKEDRLAELTKKLANFETAHAAMMKTMEAFKTLVN